MILGQWLTIAAGIVVLIVGLILFPTPVPLGAPLIAIGLIMMLGASKTMRNRFIKLRRRYPQWMGFFRKVLRWRHRFRFNLRRQRTLRVVPRGAPGRDI